jgi:peptidoglycan/xylan/chitin deacetylase (PgdA/CDA1 family)
MEKLFRFPFGACNATGMKAVNDVGMLAIQWDVSADDASPFRTADMIVKDALPAIRPGSIILAHANGRSYHAGAALSRIIAGLKARGFQCVTVSELLAAGKPVMTDTCYDFKPGDTDKYDSWA